MPGLGGALGSLELGHLIGNLPSGRLHLVPLPVRRPCVILLAGSSVEGKGSSGSLSMVGVSVE